MSFWLSKRDSINCIKFKTRNFIVYVISYWILRNVSEIFDLKKKTTHRLHNNESGLFSASSTKWHIIKSITFLFILPINIRQVIIKHDSVWVFDYCCVDLWVLFNRTFVLAPSIFIPADGLLLYKNKIKTLTFVVYCPSFFMILQGELRRILFYL